MTKQFKKDCVTLCKHFEETRVGGTTAARAARGKRGGDLPPPLLPATTVAHPPGCRCLRMLPSEMPNWHKMEQSPTLWQRLKRFCCGQRRRKQRRQPQQRRQRAYTAAAANPYQYQFAELRQQRKNRNCLLLHYGHLRTAANLLGAGQDLHSVCVTAE